MEYVMWGTGYIAGEYIGRQLEQISFFIDNDKKKQGKIFCEKKIVSPGDIVDWENIYVIIGVKDGKRVEEQLQTYGLKYKINYKWYYEDVPKDNFKDADLIIERDLEKIRKHVEWKDRKICLNRPFYAKWESVLKEETVLYMIEPGRHKTEIEELNHFAVPEIFSEHIYAHSSENSDVPMELAEKVKKDKELYTAALRIRKKHPNAQPLHEYGIVYYFFQYFCSLLHILSPECVIILNSFDAYHLVAAYACHTQKVPVIYTENGVLPGTLVFEVTGEMGESAPTVYAEEFAKLPVSEEEYGQAGEIWSYIKTSGLSRNVQWEGNIWERVGSQLNGKRPVIFYAGQNDIACGIYPYTKKSKKYHSPIFESSVQAAVYLAKVCEKNEWNFIFKPHPFVPLSAEDIEQLPKNIILADGIGVNYLVDFADVTVTIVSQTAYVALIREQPVVLMGYIQLKNKGCSYQAFEQETIENELKQALEYGLTEKQRKAFQLHIAQLIKYYLYDNCENRELRYGRSYSRNLGEIMKLEEHLQRIRSENNDNG